MEFSAGQIAALLQGELQGDSQLKINNVAKIEEGRPGCISFLANPKYEPFIYTTRSSVVLVSKSFEAKQPISATLIRVEDPYTGCTFLFHFFAHTRLSSNRCTVGHFDMPYNPYLSTNNAVFSDFG